MSRLTKEQIYELVKERGPLSTSEIREYVYADADRYRNQPDNVKSTYCLNCLMKMRKNGMVKSHIVWYDGTHHAIWEVTQ